MTDPTENGRGVQQGTGTYNYAGLNFFICTCI